MKKRGIYMSTAVATQDHVNRKHFGDLTPRMNRYR